MGVSSLLVAGRFGEACLASVTDPVLRAVPLIGAIDQVCDSTDMLENPRTYHRLAGLYDNGMS